MSGGGQRNRPMLIGAADSLVDTRTPEDLLAAKQEDQGDALVSPEAVALVVKLSPYIWRLDDRDRRLITIYYLLGRTQAEAGILEGGITQTSVSLRLAKAIRRLRLFATMPPFTAQDFERDLGAVLEPAELTACVVYWQTTSQTKAGEAIGETQWRARAVIVRSINKLRGNRATVPYAQALARMMKEFYA